MLQHLYLFHKPSKMQLLLTDERYNFRNEIRDFNSEISFKSENGNHEANTVPAVDDAGSVFYAVAARS